VLLGGDFSTDFSTDFDSDSFHGELLVEAARAEGPQEYYKAAWVRGLGRRNSRVSSRAEILTDAKGKV